MLGKGQLVTFNEVLARIEVEYLYPEFGPPHVPMRTVRVWHVEENGDILAWNPLVSSWEQQDIPVCR